ncbi:MAG TPA: cobyrinate a,c-diamide synthase, partial [Lachnospiraceae bacterium]|nr:cobyrinate a,c-diamide synthase [Lachnospiraceae bacterium]
VMGYYDGAGFTEKGSSCEIAALTQTPVILVVNAKGMSRSALAVLKGFLETDTHAGIRGVIFNRLSEKLYPALKAEAEAMGITVLGFMPNVKDAVFESRHLGLVGAAEIEDFKEKLEKLYQQAVGTIDWDRISAIADSAVPLSYQPESEIVPVIKPGTSVTAAVAKDAAFCFTYQDNLDLLKELGCKILFFSPLTDREIPQEADAVILGGGYPELYAKQLSENRTMLASVRRAAASGIPVMAECGGFLYLLESLQDLEGRSFSMAGVLKGEGYRTDRLKRFGYVYLTAEEDSLLCEKGDRLCAHEFHYYESTCNGDGLLASGTDGKRKWRAGNVGPTLYAGFPHFYLYGNKKAARRFVKAAEHCHETRHPYKKTELFLSEMKKKIQETDQQAMLLSRQKWNKIAKPLYGLGLFENAIVQIAGIQQTADVRIDTRAVVVMCADNGILEEGVAQSSEEVTAVVAGNIAEGKACINHMAQCANAQVVAVDAGMKLTVLKDRLKVRKLMSGTRNFIKEPAMSEEAMLFAFRTGVETVRDLKKEGVRIIVTGEMGIGNTTTSSAVAAVLTGTDTELMTGRGAGLDDIRLKRKKEVIRQAIEKYDLKQEDTLRTLCCVGGLDLCGLAGVFIGGAIYRIPIIIDGVITAAAALAAARLIPETKQYMLASHIGKEPAM